MKSTLRLNKYISEKGICSRREADKYIEKGAVFVNGKRAVIGAQVKPGDKVMVNGIKLDQVEEKPFILLALNKPPGIVSTAESNVKDNIVDFVNHSERIFPIGRLDKDSQGLILLTNNGDIVNEILRAGNKHEKEYIVTVDKAITDEFIEGMANGVPIMGKKTRKCPVSRVSPFVFRIILVQGMNRQIRRMCGYFGYEVTKLERVRIMNITIKGLPQGDWRELDEEEKAGIMELVEKSAAGKTPGKKGGKSYPQGERRQGRSSAVAGRRKGEKLQFSKRGDNKQDASGKDLKPGVPGKSYQEKSTRGGKFATRGGGKGKPKSSGGPNRSSTPSGGKGRNRKGN
ncbi:MAG: 23S rRNA pseudouridine(2604) synthase RluF [bacterium]